MDCQISTLVFFFLAQANTYQFLGHTVNDETTHQSDADANNCASQLCHEGYTTQSTECSAAKNTCGNTTPCAT